MAKLIQLRATLPRGGQASMLAVVAMAVTLAQPAAAQSAENFLPTEPGPASSAADGSKGESAAATPAEAAAPVALEVIPARYAGADTSLFTQPRAAALVIHTRTTDPFGQPTDPNAKPVVKKVVAAPAAAPTPQAAIEPAFPFAEVIRQISITAVMPREKQFLVGTRSIAEKDRFPIVFRGKTIEVEVVEVTSRQVLFRNLATGETSPSRLDLMPPGMRKGSEDMAAPGMKLSGQNAPLQIGPATPTSPTAPNPR